MKARKAYDPRCRAKVFIQAIKIEMTIAVILKEYKIYSSSIRILLCFHI